MGIWMSHFAPPITKRLLKGAPGVNLTNVDVFNLLAMCPFESVAKEALSPFCSMFTEDDFRAFEYTGDLEKYYRTGYASLCFFAATSANRALLQIRRAAGPDPRRGLRERAACAAYGDARQRPHHP